MPSTLEAHKLKSCTFLQAHTISQLQILRSTYLMGLGVTCGVLETISYLSVGSSNRNSQKAKLHEPGLEDIGFVAWPQSPPTIGARESGNKM